MANSKEPKKTPTLGSKGGVIGRPVGSRNKAAVTKAQLKFDSEAENAAAILIALMNNDKETLNCDSDIPATIRLNAAKEILAKSIANEKEKEQTEPKTAQQALKDVIDNGPKVFSSAK